MIQVTELHVYPVKSLRGITLQQAGLGGRGLGLDRQWMVTDETGRFVTQRQYPAMATIAVSLQGEALVLEHPAAGALAIDLAASDGPRIEVVVWRDRCPAIDQGGEAGAWLTRILAPEQSAPQFRLMRFVDSHQRPVDPDILQGEPSAVAFADAYPYLVTSESSLAALNHELASCGARSVTMDRFRPNIVVSGMPAFAEDRHERLVAVSGRYALGLRKPCQRCSITTTDQATGWIADRREPLATLMRMNPWPDQPGAYFGQNAILLSGEGERVTVGDRLRLLSDAGDPAER